MDCRQVRSKEDRKKSPVQEDVTVRVRERAKSDGRVNVEGTRPKTPSSADDIKHTSIKCPQYKAGDYNKPLFKCSLNIQSDSQRVYKFEKLS